MEGHDRSQGGITKSMNYKEEYEDQLARTVFWQRKCMQLKQDMQRIYEWDLPMVHCKRTGTEEHYETLYGSKGVQDYIRDIAKCAMRQYEREDALWLVEQKYK